MSHGIAELRTHFGAAGFLGVPELRNSLEWRLPMELCSSEAILSHPRDLGPGGSHVAVGEEWGNKSRRGLARLEGDGWGGVHTATRPQAKQSLNESPQHMARPLSTGWHTTLPPMWGPDKLCVTYHNPSDK
jgi:hypothetical protein